MANHVYNYITVNGTNAVVNQFAEIGKNFTTQRESTNWEGEPITFTEFKPIEELKFMPEYDEDEWYDWYCENVGAKWCHIEEWEDDYMNLCSAWSACTEFAGRLTTFLAETDPNVQVRHQYEDEFRNFVGIQIFWECQIGKQHSRSCTHKSERKGKANTTLCANVTLANSSNRHGCTRT